MKLADMRKKSTSELEKHADKLKNKLNTKRRDVATANESNVRELRAIRKELAKTLTVAKEVELGISTPKKAKKEKTDE